MKPSRPLQSIFLMLVVLLLVVFSAQNVQAAEFDNVKTYSEELRVVTITNAFGLGEVIGQAKLNTPLNVNVGAGYQKVAEFDIWAYDDYNDALKQFTFEDIKNGKTKINRDYDLKILEYENVTIYDNYLNCSGGREYEECDIIQNGSHQEVKEKWTKIIPADLKKNEVLTIGVFTDVQIGDFVDWIPTIYGVEVDEWATWTEDLNTDLIAYYKLDEASGTVLDSTGTYDGTNDGATPNVAGQIGTAYDFVRANSDNIQLGSLALGASGYSINAWVNVDDISDVNVIIAGHATAVEFILTNTGKIVMGRSGAAQPDPSDDAIQVGTWTMVTATYDGSNVKYYINGTASGTKAYTSTTLDIPLEIGRYDVYGSKPMNGKIDELGVWTEVLTQTQITQLWNGGTGITWTDTFGVAPSVTLTSPANDSNLTSATVEFIATVTDDEQVDNVTLYIDGVLNETNSSNVNGTYTFTKTVNEGSHNWSILAYDNASASNQSETRTFNYTQPPIFIDLLSPADASTSNIPLVNVSCEAYEDIGVEQLNLTINGIVNKTVTNSTTGQNLSLEQVINFTEGNYTWGCQALNAMTSASSSNRTFEVLYSSPVVTIVSPVNDTNVSTNTLEFVVNVTDVNGVSNVTFLIDDVVQEVNTSGVSGQYSFSDTFIEGLYNWSVSSTSIFGKVTTSETRTFNATFSTPNITLISPADDSNITSEDVSFTLTATDDNGISSLDFYINGILNETNSSGVNGSYTFTRTLSEGYYNWSVNATSTFSKEGTSGNNSFIVHLTSPTASITQPTGSQGYFLLGANETLTYSFTEAGQNLSEHLDSCWYDYSPNYADNYLSNSTWVAGVTDGYSWNFINGTMSSDNSLPNAIILDSIIPSGTLLLSSTSSTNGIELSAFQSTIPDCNSVSYSDESIYSSSTIGYYACMKNEDNFKYIIRQNDFTTRANFTSWNLSEDLNCTGTSQSFLYQEGYNSISIFARDEFGFTASNTSSWTYDLLERTQSYPNDSIESATELYVLNSTYDSDTFSIITAILNINGSEYIATKTGTGSNAIFTATVTMPSVVIPTIFETYWDVALTDLSGTTSYEVDSGNVSVGIINLTLCDATNNVSFWNFTIYNETNLVEINSSFAATFAIRTSEISDNSYFNFSDLTGTNSRYAFCLTPASSSYVADVNVKLTKSGYVDKFYEYQSVTISNATKSDNLYMMITGDSTSFIVSVSYLDGEDVIGAEVRVQRFYEGLGDWLTTEIITTNYAGDAVGHLLSEDANYRFLVYQSGVSILNSTSTKITCAVSPCTVSLTIPISIPSDVVPLEDFESSLTFSDTTNIFTYTYSDTSGDFTSARLMVRKVSPASATIIMPCNETRTAFSAIITCDINGQTNGTYQASGYITRDEETLEERITGIIGDNIYNAMGDDGVLWGIFILVGIIMLGVSRPSLSIIFGTIGLITLGLLEIVNIGALSIIAIVAVAVILLMKVGRE